MTERECDGAALEPFKAATPDAVAGVAGGLVGMAFGGPEGALVGSLTGPYVVAAGKAGNAALRQRFLKGSGVIEVACRAVRREPEELLEEITQDQAHLELLARVLEAGGRAVLPEKIEALGHVLAQGIQADTVDEALFLAAALADLEAPHIQVLEQVQKYAGTPQADVGAIGMTELRVIELMPTHRLVVPAVIRVLNLHGLIRDLTGGATTYGGMPAPRFLTTELGDRCLHLLRNEA